MDILPKFSGNATHDGAPIEASVTREHALCRMELLPPAFFLPPEILEIVFIFCADDYHNGRGLYYRGPPPSWVNVSYVCRYWRHVALGCATLWGYHFVTSLRWTEEILARSKQAPLKIHIFFPNRASSFWHDLIERLMCDADRIQELQLEGCNREILSRLSPRVPRLQHLHISVKFIVVHPGPMLTFHGDAPDLCTLQLLYSPALWHSFNVCRLTTLILCHVPTHLRQDVKAFLDTLTCTQDLIHLHLDAALARFPSFPTDIASSTSQKVTLPHLSRLSAVETVSATATLLSCLNIPPKAEVKLGFNSFPVDEYELFFLLPGQRFSMSDQTLNLEIRSLTIDLDAWPGKQAIVQFSTSERDSSDTGYDHWGLDVPLRISIHPSLWDETSNKDRFICDICRCTPLPNVHSLCVINPPFSPVFWCEMLRHLDGVRHIKLSRGNMPDLTDLRERKFMLAPMLEELELEKIAFPPDDAVDARDLAISQRRVLDVLSSRGIPRDRLVMINCFSHGRDHFGDVFSLLN